MSEYRVLISCPLIIDAIDEYANILANHHIEYDVADVDQHLTESELLDVIDLYDGVLAGDDEFTREVINSASKLKVISKWGVGIDAINIGAAEENDVAVFNTSGAFDNEVADVVIAYAIMLTRQLHQIDRAVRQGIWDCPRGTSLEGKTFGVIGVGNIGSAVTHRAHALKMDVLGTDIQPFPDELTGNTGIERVAHDELLDRADVVSLNCALTEETRGMISTGELNQLGKESYLINTARGELIDQEALVTALQEGTIAGAALDVFDQEPLPVDDPLADIDSVILGSHNAQNTHEAIERVNNRAIENLLAGLFED